MNQEELLKGYEEIKQGIDDATQSDTPFVISKDNKLSVVGDANKTEINSHDFKIVFRVPDGTTEGKKVSGGVLTEVEYKDVFISPRRATKVTSAICRLLPYFRKVSENGDVEDYTIEEITQLVADWDDEIIDTMYHVVAVFLQVDDRLVDYMQPSSVLQALTQIIHNYPEVINESDVFFS